ncbi:leucine-rich repeat protein [Hungatella hathewayi]|uniref:Leucine-rich repeat protein n=1 Tax=Hungatella hathewayi TaxID=154046 RepID=A0AAW9WDU7_9FIRM|nr:leucine-rich repeat protein [Hungatella hathewayi]MUB63500.1 leucine-rich repeat protein [Hungatella hathewayi]CUQ42541.1 S-layer protein [Hungatella hathewayi]
MRNRKNTRVLSLLLCAALLAGQLGTTVYAEGSSLEYRGVCEHHPEHTEACGYMEVKPGQPCQHEHTKDCYTNELICGFDDEYTPTATDSDASAVHEHTHECYALDCPHERGEHDDTCGYVEDVPESPCTHSCELCDPQDKGNGGEADREDGLDHSDPTLETSEQNEQTTVANDGLMPPVATMSNAASINDDGYSFENGTLTITTNAGTTAWWGSIEETAVIKIVVKDGVTKIQSNAFHGCENLTQAELPSSVTSIGLNAFRNCGNLGLTELPSGVTEIGQYAFLGCTSLALTELPSGMTSIGDKVFQNCGNLALEKLPDKVTSIGDYAFDGCKSLALEKLPDNVTSIGDYAFSDCESLALEKLPEKVTSIGEYAFSGCGNLALRSLPSDWTFIKYGAFSSCENLALTELPDKVTAIESCVFDGCKNLALEKLPSDLKSIGALAFRGCENLALKELPSSLTYIGGLAFSGCTGLTSLTIPISKAPTLASDTFDKIPNLTTIFVPAGATGYNEGWWSFYADKLVFGAALESLTISDGDLDPDFFAGRESYAVSVPNSTTSVKVTPTAHGTGTITVNDIGIDSGDTSGEITLEAGKANGIKIVVENSSTDSRTYTVTVTRAADPASSIEVNRKSLNFGTVNVGYEVGKDADDPDPRRRSVVVTNAGSQDVTLTPLTLPQFTAYELAELSKLELRPGEIADFLIYPKTGLPTGTYKEQLTINGTGGAKATVDLQFIVTDKPTYTVTVTGGTSNGTIFQEGDPVTITATVPSGKQFIGWTINPDNVTFTQGGKDTETATFTMPNQVVTATANFTDIPTTYTVMVTGGTSSGTIFQEGEPVTITAAVPSGKQFTGWTINPDNVIFTQGGKDTETATFTMPNQAVTATANFKNSSPSGGGSGSSDSSVTITPPQQPQPDSPVLAVIKAPVTVTDGAATGTANDVDTSEGIIKALNTAKQKSREKYGTAIQYDAATATAYNGFSITLKRATLDRLLDPNNNLKYLTLNTSIVDMTFGLAELTEIARQTSGDVTFTATRVTGLTGDSLSAISTRPAYDLKISYQKDGQTVYLSSVGSVSVGIAYTPAETEQAGGLYLVYADGKGGAEWLYRSSYDKGSGNVIGSINHFSIYGVGYRPAPIFTDTVNHWAKSDIDFVASRNLLTGSGDAAFSPDSTITRGMFVTVLGRLAGIDPAAYPSSSRFSDIPATAYYAPFVEWAVSKEIVNGTGAASFEPDRPVTREEMAVIMQRYAGKLGYTLPKEREAEIFADNATITSDMKDAVQAMQQAGVMNGKGGRLFAPQDTATRAEAAAVLRRFVEIVIDRDTAGGWAQNDTGSRLYYENHRPVTGWKQVEGTWYYFDAAGLMQSGGWRQIGGKWYYFYADGSMAANTEIDGYQIGPDGARNF